MGQVKKEQGNIISFSTYVEVNDDNRTVKMNNHLMDMALLVSENDQGFKERLLNALKEI